MRFDWLVCYIVVAVFCGWYVKNACDVILTRNQRGVKRFFGVFWCLMTFFKNAEIALYGAVW